jgi:hypothetical protein
MMQLPQSDMLSTSIMNRVFDNTVATYKFYWLLSLLDMHVKEQRTEMLALDVASRMVAYAWYPIEYFRLSFGKGDSMSQIIPEVAILTGITVDDRLEDKADTILTAVHEDKKVRSKVKDLLDNVPFWFLSPWINIKDKHEVIRRSQTYEGDCLYSLSGWKDTLTVTINPRWSKYLQTNYQILRDFALWHLTLFLQSKNPNMPNISGKLLRPEERESLSKQKQFRNRVIDLGANLRCIYTDNPIEKRHFDLDHFMPWSFVSHNQNWNLIPADGSFNSSKNNRIPDLDYYLPLMDAVQHRALKLYLPVSSSRDAIVNEYFTLGVSPQDLVAMSEDAFLNVYRKTFTPLSQMAQNMGFRTLKHE